MALMLPFPKQVGQVSFVVDIHGRTHALAGNLHQSKFTERAECYVLLCLSACFGTYVRTVSAGSLLDSCQ